MYEAFFHLARPPFTRGLPPDQLLSTPAMEEAGGGATPRTRTPLRRAHRGHRRRQIHRATGLPRAVTPHALHAAVRDRLPAPHPQLLLRGALATRPEPRFYRGDARRQLHQALQARDDAGKQPVIVIDEAHLLGRAMLEEVRFLLNFDIDSRAPLGSSSPGRRNCAAR